MNKDRRKRLVEAYENIVKAQEIIEEVNAEEKESYDNLPDNFRDGDRGQEMQDYIDMLDDAQSVVDQI